MTWIGKLLNKSPGRGNRRRKARGRDAGSRELHVLNVRVDSKRSRKVRRTRTLLRGGRIALMAAGCLAVILAAKAFVNRVYYQNPTFELGRLFIETDGDLPRPAILRQSGIRRDDHLLDLDLDLVRSRIKAMPQVADVQVERQLPDIVAIRVRERVPLAWLDCPAAGARPHQPDGGWFIDAHGRIFPCGGLADEHLDLPIIQVEDLPPLIGKVKVDSGRIMDALRLIQLNDERFFDEQLEIDRIDCARDYSMIVSYQNEASVVFGTRDLEGQLDDLAAILAFAKDEGLQIATLNLMVKENKPITFFDGPTSWDEMPILRAAAPVSRGEQRTVVAGEGDGVAAGLPASASPSGASASRQARDRDGGGAGRGRGSDVRAIMGSLYD